MCVCVCVCMRARADLTHGTRRCGASGGCTYAARAYAYVSTYSYVYLSAQVSLSEIGLTHLHYTESRIRGHGPRISTPLLTGAVSDHARLVLVCACACACVCVCVSECVCVCVGVCVSV